MMLHAPGVLTQEQLVQCHAALAETDRQDGNATCGPQSALAKCNAQVPQDSAVARVPGATILDALQNNPLFISAALSRRIFPPLFSRYGEGQGFGSHVDNAVRRLRGTGPRIRTDLSATLFLSPQHSCEGGALVVDDTFGSHSVRLPAGAPVLYASSSLHRVTPVIRGTRVAAFFWIESMVRETEAGRLLFQADAAIQSVAGRLPAGDEAVLHLTGLYRNLMRRWADS